MTLLRRALLVSLLVSGSLLALRPQSRHSLLNAESCFALALLALLLTAPRPATALTMAASLSALTGACFLRTLNSPFLSDDFVLLQQARHFEWRHAAALFTRAGGDGFFRPAGYLSLALTAPWAGLDPLRWHAAALALHTANAALVWALARKWGAAEFVAILAAALFAIHGTRPETAVWVAGRFDLLATFFVLAGLLATNHWAALACMTLGILSKESAYAFPLLLAIRGRPARAAFAVAAMLFVWRWMLLGGIGGYGGTSMLPAASALAMRLWAVLLFPLNWSVPPESAWIPVYLVCLAVLVRARPDRGAILSAAAFTLAAALPALPQLQIGADLQKSRLVYLASAGFCLLLAHAVHGLGPLGMRAAVTAGVVAFHLAALQHNLEIWRDVSLRARAFCEAPATAIPPRSIHGVYFFANGLPECQALKRDE